MCCRVRSQPDSGRSQYGLEAGADCYVEWVPVGEPSLPTLIWSRESVPPKAARTKWAP